MIHNKKIKMMTKSRLFGRISLKIKWRRLNMFLRLGKDKVSVVKVLAWEKVVIETAYQKSIISYQFNEQKNNQSRKSSHHS